MAPRKVRAVRTQDINVEPRTSDYDRPIVTPAGLVDRRLPGTPLKTLSNWRYTGFGPPYLKVGSKIYYDLRVVDEWLKSRQRASTSDVA